MRKTSTLVGLVLFSLAGSALARNKSTKATKEAPAAEEEAAETPAADSSPASPPAATPVAEPVGDAKPADVAPAQPAEAAAAARLTLGVDAAAQIPVSSAFRNQNVLGLGGLLRVELNLIRKLNLTLRGGYIYGLEHHFQGTFQDVDYKTSTLPIWIGGKYLVTDTFYGAVEVGYHRLAWSYEGTLAGVPSHNSGTDNKYGGTVGAGVIAGPVDFKAQLEILDVGHASDSMAVMVNVGYSFLKLLN